jgi:hypothetical protein
MGKNPYLSFHTGDWLKDPKLGQCSPATRGVWIDAICAMNESDSDRLAGSLDQLSRILRATVSEVQSAIDELQVTGTARVTLRNNFVTVVSKRREREAKARENTRLRVRRHRGNDDVTQKKHSIPYSHIPFTPLIPPNGGNGKCEEALEKFRDIWKAYPAHRRNTETIAYSAWAALNPDLETARKIMRAILTLKESDKWLEKKGQFVPGFAKWIGERGWEAVECELELPPEPAGSEPRPPKGMKWARDESGELIHPLTAVAIV